MRNFIILFLFLCCCVTPAWATSCSVNAESMSFGVYNPFSTIALSAQSTITVSCDTSISSFQLQFNQGMFGNFSMRQMGNGSDRLNYNLYADPSHTMILGDGTAGTNVINGGGPCTSGDPCQTTFYGQLFPLQTDSTVGSYTDQVVVTVNY